MLEYYIANIGKRDVVYDKNVIKNTREDGKYYLDNYEKYKDKLDFPIISRGLESIINKGKISRVILFYTNQDKESVANFFWNYDTIYFAEIIKKIIEEKYHDKVKDVVLYSITEEPNDYGTMFQYYNKKIIEIENTSKPDIVYLAPAGGIPACNMALVMLGSKIFGNRANALLISENIEKQPDFMSIAKDINRDYNRNVISEMLKYYNFSGISELLNQNQSLKIKSINHLVKYMKYRLTFDFSLAALELNSIKSRLLKMPTKLIDKYSSIDAFIQSLKTELDKLSIKPIQFCHGENNRVKENWIDLQKKLSAEIAINTRIKWRSENYVDFLGRCFRLQEGLLRWIFEYESGYSADMNMHYNDFPNYLKKEGKDFDKFLDELEKKENKTYNRNLNRKILLYFLQYISKSTDTYKDLMKICFKFDHLSNLRNQSILAHGNMPVTKQRLNEIYGKKKIERDLSTICKKMNNTDGFESINHIIEIIKYNY